MFGKLINIYKQFDTKLKLRLIYTQLIILIASVVEILSIFSIGPLVQILSKPSSIYDKNQLVGKAFDYFNFTSFENFLVFVVIIIFILLSISVIMLTINQYLITIYSQILGNELRASVYKFYISQPWLYHSRSNTADYISIITAETGRVTNNVIFNILNTNSKIFTGFFILIFLAFYNIKVALTAISFIGSMYIIIFVVVRQKIELYGKLQSQLLSDLYKVMSESFLGIKETIIYGKKKFYFDKFSKIGKDWGLAIAKSHFLTLAPRQILEFLAFSIILFFILVMVFVNDTNFNDTLPIIAVYIFAGYKLLPIFQAVYHGISQLKGNIFAIDKIEFELTESKKYNLEEESDISKKHNILKAEETLKFNDVSFSYQETDKAVFDINLEIKRNTLNFIVGPSGSGKSTLLDLILGLIFPKRGEIIIGPNRLTSENSKYWHQNIGYVGQNIFLIDDTIKNNICLNELGEEFNEEKFNRALKLSYVNTFIEDMPKGTETVVGERGVKLSGGQRQRVAMARALYQDKKIMILDEATASLDGIAEKFIIDQLKELSNNITIIMVTHNVKLCKYADMIYLLKEGSILKSGKYEELIKEDLFLKLLNE